MAVTKITSETVKAAGPVAVHSRDERINWYETVL